MHRIQFEEAMRNLQAIQNFSEAPLPLGKNRRPPYTALTRSGDWILLRVKRAFLTHLFGVLNLAAPLWCQLNGLHERWSGSVPYKLAIYISSSAKTGGGKC